MSSHKFVKKILPQPQSGRTPAPPASRNGSGGVSFISEKARALSLRDQLAKILEDGKKVEKAARILEQWLHGDSRTKPQKPRNSSGK